jgi:uncharacterized protein (TIGR00251 family)
VKGSTRIALRVAPGAQRAKVVGRHGSAWKLRVTAAPEDGKANEAVVRLLAETLGVPRSDVAIVSGHGARDKVVSLTGLGAAEVEQRLEASIAYGSQDHGKDAA